MLRVVVIVAAALGSAATALSLWVAPAIAAGALLHRSQTPLYRARPVACVDETFAGDGVTLRGWRCVPTTRRRGAIVYLHGIGDNRSGAAGVAERFGPLGYEVVAYDSRAHGQSEGAVCTYGIREREDLRRVVATIQDGPIILIGSSLGAAVAIQTSSIEARISGVVAAEVFADLKSIANERGRRLWLPPWTIARALRIAQLRAGIQVDDASPVAAARLVRVPVLLLHGADDQETSTQHSRLVQDALAGPRSFVVVPHAGHNQTLAAPGVWDRVEAWIQLLPESRIPNPTPEGRGPSAEGPVTVGQSPTATHDGYV